jgi:hypothetical protein
MYGHHYCRQGGRKGYREYPLPPKRRLNAYPFPLPATTDTSEIDPFAQWKTYTALYWTRTLHRWESRRAWKSVTNAPAAIL